MFTGGRGNLFKNCCISLPPKQLKTQAVLLADFQHGRKKKRGHICSPKVVILTTFSQCHISLPCLTEERSCLKGNQKSL